MSIFKKQNIPNFLSVFRILLVPIFIYFFQIQKKRILSVSIFLFAGLTDIIDGFLARHFSWTSDTGKILDPFADKCMQISAVVCMSLGGFIPTWIVAILIIKEFVLLIGGIFALKKEKLYVQSDWYGKAGTVAFYIIVTLLVTVKGMPESIKQILSVVLIVFMLFALVMYVIKYKNKIVRQKVGKVN